LLTLFFWLVFAAVAQVQGEKVEYRVWNPFRSKIAAAILGGIETLHIKVRQAKILRFSPFFFSLHTDRLWRRS
jgi:hypothetical protein